MSTSTLTADLPKLLGVIRYELLIDWRQRRWLIAGIGICGIELLFLFAFQQLIGQVAVEDRPRLALALLFALQPAMQLFALLIPPSLSSESMPRDRRWNLGDLLNTLPIPDGVFLTGKLFATMINAILLLLITGVFAGVVCALLIGSFDLGEYAVMLLIGILPIAAFSAGITMLLTAGQRVRRVEIAVILIFNMICLIGLGIDVIGNTTIGDYLNPAFPLIMRHYFIRYLNLSPSGAAQSIGLGDVVSLEQIVLAILIAALELVVGWLIVRYWLLRQR